MSELIPGGRERIRALTLLSGGLDSQLAVCVLRDLGIDVQAVAFESPFFNPKAPRDAARQLDVPLHVLDFTADIVSLVENPPHGFGSCMNPCIDCHARMLRRAGHLMEDLGFHFLSTGEVLNERPMSQNRSSLDLVARESGYASLVLRPLSAALLPPTQPEKLGWVERSRLLSLEGRGRKPQLELAARYGLKNFPNPAGGCRLTEPEFCKRLKELKDHEGLRDARAIHLLRYGRHFRLADHVKLIVGRHEGDNSFLEGNAELYDLVLKVESHPGPSGLLPSAATEEQVQAAAAICARYSDAPPGAPATVQVRSPRGLLRLEVLPARPQDADRWKI